MDVGSIFLILALFIVVALFVSKPLFEHQATSVSKTEQAYSALLAEHDRVVSALKELEFDFALGKIPEEDYPRQRQALILRGAELLKELDAYKEKFASAKVVSEQAEQPGEQLEKKPIEASSVQRDDVLESLIAERKRKRQGKAVGFCPQCGAPIHESDMFCSRCGAKLA